MHKSIFISLIISLFSFSAIAQQTSGPNVWLGNTYGPSDDWHFPGNWSKGHVPLETEDVIIPDVSNKGQANYPIITFEAEVNRIRVASEARLIIAPEGKLHIQSIHGETGLMSGEVMNLGLIMIGLGDKDSRKPFEDDILGSIVLLSF